jgi:biopolymer transport protein ExbD
MKLQTTPIRKARIEMLPLIDIVFLLLVFFIYAMLSMAVHRGLPVRLPNSQAAEIEQKLTLSVTVKAGGAIYVDKEPVSLERLPGVLREKARNRPEAGVLLFGDRSVSYQQLFRILDRIRMAGLTRISLQAEKPQP